MDICEHCGNEVEPAENWDTEIGTLCPDCRALAVEDGEIDENGYIIEEE